jgi:hypothetical protein
VGARKGELKNQRHGGQKRSSDFLTVGCSIACEGIDAPDFTYRQLTNIRQYIAKFELVCICHELLIPTGDKVGYNTAPREELSNPII